MLGGFTPKIAIDMDQLLSAYYVACDGIGITLARDTSLRYVASTSNLCFYRLPPELSHRNIYLTYQKKSKERAITQLFLDYISSQSNRLLTSQSRNIT